MTSYGFKAPVYGMSQGGYLRPRSSLATQIGSPLLGGGTSAANPFGLASIKSGSQAKPAPVGLAPATTGSNSAATPAAGLQVPPAAAPAAAQTTTAPAAASYDFTADPALQQVVAYAGKTDAEAQAQALRDKTQLVEQYGDPNLAAALGLGADVANVAKNNPASLLGRAKTSHDQSLNQLEDQLNKDNLFYSGYRTKQLSQDAQNYQNGLADLSSQVQGKLSGIDSALAQALGTDEYNVLQAEQAARDRQLQNLPTTTAGGAAAGAPAEVALRAPQMTLAQALQNYGPTPQQRVRFIGV